MLWSGTLSFASAFLGGKRLIAHNHRGAVMVLMRSPREPARSSPPREEEIVVGNALLFFLFLLLLPPPAYSAVYEVGPGKAYANIGDVPWESMGPGDQTLIYWRSEPYREKWVIAVRGTEQQPCVVRGIPNRQGQRPVIDGRDASTRSKLNFWNEERGVIKIGGANKPDVEEPCWIVLKNLDIRSGRPPYEFTGRYGVIAYTQNAASVYVECGRHISIKNCILRDSGNGLFVSQATRDIRIEECRFYDNGIENSIYQHNAYTAALGIIYQFNYFGPLRPNCLGNNLKDRSAGLKVRYNWIESGNRQLDLVDAEDSMDLVEHPSYRRTFVYGNVLLETANSGNSQIVHYGGDSGDESIYRKGTLYFYNNTVVSKRPDNTTLLRLSTNDETCDYRNNIVWTSATGNHLALLNQAGVLHLRNNWLKSGWVASHSGLTGTIHDQGKNIEGEAPRFAAVNKDNLHLVKNSPCVEAGAPLHPDAYPLKYQYVKVGKHEVRPADGTLDLGAFEVLQ